MRLLMTAFVFGIPETKMRCIAPAGRRRLRDEDLPLPRVRARRRRSPRRSAGRSSGSRRGARTTSRRRTAATTSPTSRSARSATARSPALKAKTYANLGGILSTIAPGIPTTLYGRMLSGAYRIPNIHCQVLGVYTNTGMVDAYRGAGRPEATYVVERASRPRRARARPRPGRRAPQELHPARRVPVRPRSASCNGLEYDTGDYEKALDRALEIVDYEDFRTRAGRGAEAGPLPRHRLLDLRRDLRRRARRRGSARSARAGARRMWESANVRVHLTGKVVVTIGSQPHGQGHETTLSPDRRRRARRPDRGRDRRASATRSARRSATAPTAAAAPRSARSPSTTALQKIKEKARRIGAHMLEADVEDVVFEDGKAFVKGSPDNAKTIQEIAGAAALAYDLPEGEEPFLDDTTYYDPPNCTFPFGTHVAVVEVDAETGEVDARALRRGRRRRQRDQPDDRRRPGARRHRAGHRPGALGGRRLRRERPAADGEPDGLRDPEGRLLPAVRGRPDGDADRRQPARRQGRRRDRDDRVDAGGRERGRRRARAARHHAPRHAAHAGARLARDAAKPRRGGADVHDASDRVRVPPAGEPRRGDRAARRGRRTRSRSPAATACCR